MTQEQFEFFGKIAMFMLGFHGASVLLLAWIGIIINKK